MTKLCWTLMITLWTVNQFEKHILQLWNTASQQACPSTWTVLCICHLLLKQLIISSADAGHHLLLSMQSCEQRQWHVAHKKGLQKWTIYSAYIAGMVMECKWLVWGWDGDKCSEDKIGREKLLDARLGCGWINVSISVSSTKMKLTRQQFTICWLSWRWIRIEHVTSLQRTRNHTKRYTTCVRLSPQKPHKWAQ